MGWFRSQKVGPIVKLSRTISAVREGDLRKRVLTVSHQRDLRTRNHQTE